ncbi:MAG: acyltransferase family protein [Pseudodesulfovibrio sp.]|uniref:acyltransferase family protein n=1 Tax=Pseudodesulfovibrio sp. TaxID=2035812 RepID=UPI003D0AF134
MPNQLVQTFSRNAYSLKFLSILVVATAHFMAARNWNIPFADKAWVPQTYALVFFAFTSGYFTSLRYGGQFDIRKFWKNKLSRLGIEYTVINMFLVGLFLIERKQNIFSLRSVLSWLGLKGFITWFKIPLLSPFGAGLWFLTLLLLFYIAYPAIAYFCRNRASAWIFTSAIIAMMVYFDATIHFDHMLWITASGFFLGVFFNSRSLFLSLRSCFYILIAEALVIAATAYFGHKISTGGIILFTSIPLIFLFFHFDVPETLQRVIRPVQGTVLAVYIIHTYLFVFPTQKFLPDYLLSMSLAIAVACILNRLSRFVTRRLTA